MEVEAEFLILHDGDEIVTAAGDWCALHFTGCSFSFRYRDEALVL